MEPGSKWREPGSSGAGRLLPARLVPPPRLAFFAADGRRGRDARGREPALAGVARQARRLQRETDIPSRSSPSAPSSPTPATWYAASRPATAPPPTAGGVKGESQKTPYATCLDGCHSGNRAGVRGYFA